LISYFWVSPKKRNTLKAGHPYELGFLIDPSIFNKGDFTHLKMVNSHLKMVPPQQKNKVFLVVIPIVTLANLSPVTISTPKSVVFFRPRLTWWNKTHRHDRLEKLGSFDPFRLPFSFPVFDGKVDEGSQKTPKKCTTRRFFVLFRPNFGVESESSFFSRLQNLKKHRISDIVSPKQKL